MIFSFVSLASKHLTRPIMLVKQTVFSLLRAILHVSFLVKANQSTGRTGNWTSLTCTDPAVEGLFEFSPSQQWSMLDCDDAWNDAVADWRTIDQPARFGFSESISNTFHINMPAACESLDDTNNCDNTILCTQGPGTGPAGYKIWNSLVMVHAVCVMITSKQMFCIPLFMYS